MISYIKFTGRCKGEFFVHAYAKGSPDAEDAPALAAAAPGCTAVVGKGRAGGLGARAVIGAAGHCLSCSDKISRWARCGVQVPCARKARTSWGVDARRSWPPLTLATLNHSAHIKPRSDDARGGDGTST